MNRVIVGPPVLQHRPADQQQHPGRGHRRLTLTPTLRNPVIRTSHRRVKPEVDVSRLHHRPPEPRRALLGDPAVAGDASAAVGRRGETRIARQLVPRSEPGDVTNLGLHQNRRVVAHTGDGGQQPYLLVTGRDVPELQGQQLDLLLQGRHEPEVALQGL